MRGETRVAIAPFPARPGFFVSFILKPEVAGGKYVNIFGIGLPEMAVILGLALLIFGPKKLPEIGRSMGKAIRGFQEASRDFESEFKRETEQLEQAAKAAPPAKLEKMATVTPEETVASQSQQG